MGTSIPKASPADRIRAFVAIRMAPAVDDAIIILVDELRKFGADVSWVKPANLHLTLKFLGAAVESARVTQLSEALIGVAARTAPFAVRCRGTGAFPNLSRPRAIWLALQSGELVHLATDIEDAAAEVGFARERRPYSPHLTIGRVRGLRHWTQTRRALESSADNDFGESLIESMALYRSHLSPSGASYEILGKFGFSR